MSPSSVPHTTPDDLPSSRTPSGAPSRVREHSQRFAGRTSHYDFDLGGDLFAGRRVRLADCGDVWAVPGQYAANARNAAAWPDVRRAPRAGSRLEDEVNGVREGAPSAMRRVAELPWVTSMIQIGLRGSGSARSRDEQDAFEFGSVLVRAEELHEVGVPTILRRIPRRRATTSASMSPSSIRGSLPASKLRPLEASPTSRPRTC